MVRKGQSVVMKTCFGLLLLSSLGLGGTAQADEKVDCANPASTADQNQCADMAFQKADSELNALWPKVKAWAEQSDKDADVNNKHDYKDAVLVSQRAWIAYRDADA